MYFLRKGGEVASNRWLGAYSSFCKQTGMITSTLAQFPDHSQIAVVVLTGNETLYFGAIRQHDTIRPCNNANGVFEIGSITKVFTTQFDGCRQIRQIKSLDNLLLLT